MLSSLQEDEAAFIFDAGCRCRDELPNPDGIMLRSRIRGIGIRAESPLPGDILP